MLKPRLFLTVLALAAAVVACGGKTNSANQSPAANNQTAQAPANNQTAQAPGNDVTSSWVSYTSPKGSYTAKFPSKPKEETQTLDTKAGKTDLVLVSYEDRANRRAYAVSHNRFTIPQGMKFDVQKGLDGSRDGIANGIGATVSKETKITSKTGYPGREVIMAKGGADVAKARIYYGDGILYQIFVLADNKKLSAPEVDAFLNSVEFSK